MLRVDTSTISDKFGSELILMLLVKAFEVRVTFHLVKDVLHGLV